MAPDTGKGASISVHLEAFSCIMLSDVLVNLISHAIIQPIFGLFEDIGNISIGVRYRILATLSGSFLSLSGGHGNVVSTASESLSLLQTTFILPITISIIIRLGSQRFLDSFIQFVLFFPSTLFLHRRCDSSSQSDIRILWSTLPSGSCQSICHLL